MANFSEDTPMALIYTLTDKTLMMRAARQLKEQADVLLNRYGTNWAENDESKGAKRKFDRLLRDERDLRMLAKRFEKVMKVQEAEAAAQVAPLLAAPVAAPSTAGDPDPIVTTTAYVPEEATA